MSSFGFGLLCLLTFAVPVPILAWLDQAGHFAAGLAIKAKVPRAPTWLELAFIAISCAYDVTRAKRDRTFGGHAVRACAVVVVLHVFNSPWMPTLK